MPVVLGEVDYKVTTPGVTNAGEGASGLMFEVVVLTKI
jgi:hypothetical protein